MNDVICTYCRGATTSGCEHCNPALSSDPIEKLEDDLAYYEGMAETDQKRIAELEEIRYDLLLKDSRKAHRIEELEAAQKRLTRLQRYDLPSCDGGEMTPHSDGDWLLRNDVLKAIKEQQE